jgi:hypothetical protein
MVEFFGKQNNPTLGHLPDTNTDQQVHITRDQSII